MPSLARLLQKNSDGEGTKPMLSIRVPEAFRSALQQRAKEQGLSMSKTLIEAAWQGDPKLRQLSRQFVKTGGKAR